MKMNKLTKKLSLVICNVLIAAMVLFTSGCGGSNDNVTELPQGAEETQVPETTEMPEATEVPKEESQYEIKGEGNTSFVFIVTDADGNESAYEIHTDKTTVGEALIDLEMIAGDPGDYGLYVKTVDGITVDYDIDGMYWAFYVDGEYATSGVDTTDIAEGSIYSFKVEK